MKPERIENLLCEFSRRRVLVIRDLLLNEFVWGQVSRVFGTATLTPDELRESSSQRNG
jgi:bifunctional ADP-heptose synthase (sugar kinase/adenylyltransferase)